MGGGEPGETPDRPGESQVEVGTCSAGREEPGLTAQGKVKTLHAVELHLGE